MFNQYILCTALIAISFNPFLNTPASGEEQVARADVLAAMKKASEFYQSKLAVQGGYVYHYSLDLSQRWGEGLATADQIWVQPPGTPTIGRAYLAAYRASGDDDFLAAAVETAEVLVHGQLHSGGWQNSIDCRAGKEGFPYSGGKKRLEGNSSLDDGQTQSALMLLIEVDEALQFKNEAIHQAALFALDSLLAAQYANGGFPQVWRAPVSQQPVIKANYPKHDWRTEGRIKNYWDMYTLNDNVPGYTADALFTAYRVYQQEKYRTALQRLGEFLMLAQMPQPGWAQQYNYDMQPIWARKFEPPGVSGDESQEVIETLMKIAVSLDNPKFLKPIPRAIDYLRKSELPGGELARYYELQTNKPLYMVRKGNEYSLTYDDSNLPKHYAFKTKSKLDRLAAQYESLKSNLRLPGKKKKPTASQIRKILAELDDQGRWVSTYRGESLVGQPKFAPGSKYLSSEVFSRNLTTLSEYLQP